jgi:hypothetical protein
VPVSLPPLFASGASFEASTCVLASSPVCDVPPSVVALVPLGELLHAARSRTAHIPRRSFMASIEPHLPRSGRGPRADTFCHGRERSPRCELQLGICGIAPSGESTSHGPLPKPVATPPSQLPVWTRLHGSRCCRSRCVANCANPAWRLGSRREHGLQSRATVAREGPRGARLEYLRVSPTRARARDE